MELAFHRAVIRQRVLQNAFKVGINALLHVFHGVRIPDRLVNDVNQARRIGLAQRGHFNKRRCTKRVDRADIPVIGVPVLQVMAAPGGADPGTRCPAFNR